ncbi:MAG: ACP S-malonyltransferase [Gemmatimonadota bacterium]
MSGPERLAVVLPGQGSQFVGMGRELAEAYPFARECYERADEVLGVPLSRIAWVGPADILTQTQNAQPAILLHSYVAWSLLPPELRERTVVAAGHSLGEFTAYLIAGALSLEDALRVVRRRGELMWEAGQENPGSMAAIIGLAAEVVEELCAAVDGTVVPANYNSPGQIVISGEIPAVAAACEEAKARGAKRALPLPVSGAFHSPLMERARAGLEEALESVEVLDPGFPIIANAVAEPVEDAARARELLIAQLTSPVRWIESVRRMQEYQPQAWVEPGPGAVLTGLARRIDKSISVRSVGDPAGLEFAVEGLRNG